MVFLVASVMMACKCWGNGRPDSVAAQGGPPAARWSRGGQWLLLSSRSVVFDSVTPWTAAFQAPLSFTVSQSLLKFMSIESVMLSNHLILCCPLLLLPSIFPSIVFPGGSDGKESACNAGDQGSIPGSGTSLGEGKERQYYSSILAWRIPRTEEPGGLYSLWGCKELDWVTNTLT